LRGVRASGHPLAFVVLLGAIMLFAPVMRAQTTPNASQKSAITSDPTVEVARPSAPPASAPAPAPLSAPNNYQLSANDQIAVEVFGEDDLRTSARLNSDGNVSLPLLGSVRLAGLTLSQAASRLTELYGKDYL